MVNTRSSCQNGCNQYSWCIGYSHLESKALCRLFTSKESGPCPSGYNLKVGPTVTSIDQLIGKTAIYVFSGCYGKITGKTKISFTKKVTQEIKNHFYYHGAFIWI